MNEGPNVSNSPISLVTVTPRNHHHCLTQAHAPTNYSPDADAHQPHNSLIEAVKEVPQDMAFVLHATNDQPEGQEKTTRPKVLMPLAEPGTGTVSSKFITSCRVPKAWVTFSRMLVSFSTEDGGDMEAPSSDPFSVLTIILVTTRVLYCILN